MCQGTLCAHEEANEELSKQMETKQAQLLERLEHQQLIIAQLEQAACSTPQTPASGCRHRQLQTLEHSTGEEAQGAGGGYRPSKEYWPVKHTWDYAPEERKSHAHAKRKREDAAWESNSNWVPLATRRKSSEECR